MDWIKKSLRLDQEHPPYKLIAGVLCGLLITLGIVLIAIGATGSGVGIILLALLCLSVVLFKKQLRRIFNPSTSDKLRDLIA
ncbi:hypothetical protein [Asticcacaulis sp.]|uniref:hypothetical protein n=1 Tax=Asticcacaulis sp. TaxID=1872648 RepID=UPI00261E66F1|nr:hypothetical protein [Asticcacaulis sp.]